jgi:hypothetical protein
MKSSEAGVVASTFIVQGGISRGGQDSPLLAPLFLQEKALGFSESFSLG